MSSVSQMAREIRSSRPREIHFYDDALPATEFAAAVLSNHTRAIHAWSRWWRRDKADHSEFFEMLERAMVSQEFFTGDCRQLLNFHECCRLLRVDPADIWTRVWRDIDPSAWCLLTGLRAVEMIVCGDPGDEPSSMAVGEFDWEPTNDAA